MVQHSYVCHFRSSVTVLTSISSGAGSVPHGTKFASLLCMQLSGKSM